MLIFNFFTYHNPADNVWNTHVELIVLIIFPWVCNLLVAFLHVESADNDQELKYLNRSQSLANLPKAPSIGNFLMQFSVLKVVGVFII